MLPLQALADPAMAIVLFTIVMTLVINLAFIWAYYKIKPEPETLESESDEAGEGGGTGA